MSRVFTPSELADYDGVKRNEIHFSVRGKVYDVTDARDFYGPGDLYCAVPVACLHNLVQDLTLMTCMLRQGVAITFLLGRNAAELWR